jgi:hypothetical protein
MTTFYYYYGYEGYVLVSVDLAPRTKYRAIQAGVNLIR